MILIVTDRVAVASITADSPVPATTMVGFVIDVTRPHVMRVGIRHPDGSMLGATVTRTALRDALLTGDAMREGLATMQLIAVGDGDDARASLVLAIEEEGGVNPFGVFIPPVLARKALSLSYQEAGPDADEQLLITDLDQELAKILGGMI